MHKNSAENWLLQKGVRDTGKSTEFGAKGAGKEILEIQVGDSSSTCPQLPL